MLQLHLLMPMTCCPAQTSLHRSQAALLKASAGNQPPTQRTHMQGTYMCVFLVDGEERRIDNSAASSLKPLPMQCEVAREEWSA